MSRDVGIAVGEIIPERADHKQKGLGSADGTLCALGGSVDIPSLIVSIVLEMYLTAVSLKFISRFIEVR